MLQFPSAVFGYVGRFRRFHRFVTPLRFQREEVVGEGSVFLRAKPTEPSPGKLVPASRNKQTVLVRGVFGFHRNSS